MKGDLVVEFNWVIVKIIYLVWMMNVIGDISFYYVIVEFFF